MAARPFARLLLRRLAPQLSGRPSACFASATKSARRASQLGLRIQEQLSGAAHVKDVIRIYQEYGPHFNDVNLATCWQRLAQVAGNTQRPPTAETRAVFRALQQNTGAVLPRLRAARLRGIVQAMVKLERWGCDQRLWQAVQTAVQGFCKEMTPRNLATIAWAFAKSRKEAPELFEEIAVASIPQLGSFQPVDLAMMAWSFSTVGHHAPELFHGIAHESTARVNALNAQDLANIAWAFANAHHEARALFDAIASETLVSGEIAKPRDLANMVWAFAKAKHESPALFQAAAITVAPKCHELKPIELSMCAWAFCRARQKAPVLFDRIAHHASSKIDQFDPQALSMLVWAFAAMKHPAPDLFHAVRRVCTPHLDSFASAGLAKVAWAIAQAGPPDATFFEAVAKESTLRLNEFNAQEIAMLASAFAVSAHYSPELLDAMAVVAASDTSAFSTRNIASMCQSYAALRHPAKSLFDAFGAEAELHVQNFSHNDLVQIAWSFLHVDYDRPSLFDAITAEVMRRIEGLSAAELSRAASVFVKSERCWRDLALAISSRARHRLMEFDPNSLALTARAFAGSQHDAPALLEAIGDAVVSPSTLCSLSDHNLADLTWALAMTTRASPAFLEEIAAETSRRLPALDSYSLSNVAYAFCIADVLPVASPLFDERFARRCEELAYDFSVEDLSQLYQWKLWYVGEKGCCEGLPTKGLLELCHAAFRATDPTPSRTQSEVRAALADLGLRVEEEVRLREGFMIDLVVEWQGKRVALEVDGPWHFYGRRPKGATLFKRRQLVRLHWPLVSIAYWEWDALHMMQGAAERREAKHAYLIARLNDACGAAPGS